MNDDEKNKTEITGSEESIITAGNDNSEDYLLKLKTSLENKEKVIIGMKRMISLLLLLLTVSIAMIIYFGYEIDELTQINNDLNQRTVTPILEEIMEIKPPTDTSSQSFLYQSINGKPLKYFDLVKINDSLILILKTFKKDKDSILDIIDGQKETIDFKNRLLGNLKEEYSLYYYTKPSEPDTYYLNSGKIDSAYILYKLVGKALVHEKDKNRWRFVLDSIK